MGFLAPSQITRVGLESLNRRSLIGPLSLHSCTGPFANQCEIVSLCSNCPSFHSVYPFVDSSGKASALATVSSAYKPVSCCPYWLLQCMQVLYPLVAPACSFLDAYCVVTVHARCPTNKPARARHKLSSSIGPSSGKRVQHPIIAHFALHWASSLSQAFHPCSIAWLSKFKFTR